jgi:hypothetical protein
MVLQRRFREDSSARFLFAFVESMNRGRVRANRGSKRGEREEEKEAEFKEGEEKGQGTEGEHIEEKEGEREGEDAETMELLRRLLSGRYSLVSNYPTRVFKSDDAELLSNTLSGCGLHQSANLFIEWWHDDEGEGEETDQGAEV